MLLRNLKRSNEEGAGFGLAIVSEVAATHGWDICLTGGDAGGARFEIVSTEHVA
jgi:signal transduction histidine kinase